MVAPDFEILEVYYAKNELNAQEWGFSIAFTE